MLSLLGVSLLGVPSPTALLATAAGEAVAELKEQPGKDLVVLGRGELVQSLMRHNLVD